MEVRDVRELRDFAYRLVHPGRRYLCAGLGLGLGGGTRFLENLDYLRAKKSDSGGASDSTNQRC